MKQRWYWYSYGILANTELIEKGQTNQVVGRDNEGEIGEEVQRDIPPLLIPPFLRVSHKTMKDFINVFEWFFLGNRFIS